MARQIRSNLIQCCAGQYLLSKPVDVMFMCMKLLFCPDIFCFLLRAHILFITDILILSEIECYEVRSFISALFTLASQKTWW